MDAARNYDNYPPNAPLGWMDADMYRCIYAGYTWHPRRYRQYCTDGNGALVDPSQAWAAAHVWRDEVVKPIIDIYGQELSQAAQGDELGRPMALMIAGQLLSADEHASPCAGCGERNLSDYAFQTYGMGAKSTGVNPDTGSGNGSDSLYAEYRNWPNVFKLNWPRWLTVGEHGVNSIGGGHCCDDPQELYWAVLTGLDLHMSQLHFLGSDLGQPGAGAEAARQLFARYAGRGIFTTPDVWIVFRDTEGTYYPNGDNGQPEGDPPGRRPCCRALPNYEWFIYQRNPAPEQVVRTGLPDAYQSLSARSDAYGALQLDIEDLWWGSRPPIVPLACRAYDVEVEFLDAGVDSFLVRYATPDGAVVSRSVQKTGTGRWRSVTLNLQDVAFSDGLPSGADLTLANPDGSPDIFHRVRVELLGDCQ